MVALLLSAALGRPERARAQSALPQHLTLATYAYSTNDRVANLAPLGEHLSARLGIPVRVVSFPDVQRLIAAIRGGDADIALLSTFGYLLLVGADSSAAEPVAAMRLPPGQRGSYQSVIVANRAAPVSSVEKLSRNARGLSFFFVAPGSTSGNLVPRLFLATQGVADPEGMFKQVQYEGTHAGTLAAVRAGRAELGAFGSDEFDRSIASDPALEKEIRLLWRSEEIAQGPVVVRRAVPAALRGRIQEILLRLDQDAPAAFASVAAGWTEAKGAVTYEAVKDSDYESVRRMFGEPRHFVGILERFIQ